MEQENSTPRRGPGDRALRHLPTFLFRDLPVSLFCLVPITLFLLFAVASVALGAGVTDEDVRHAIERGVGFLKREQNKDKGNWSEISLDPCGASALSTLALLSCGVEVKDPAIQRALDYLRGFDEPQATYSTALQTMVFCLAEPERDRLQIKTNVTWLESNQIKTGANAGAWHYGKRGGRGDPSNAQFALLALHEAERIGVEVKREVWETALGYWQRTQRADGAWGYADEWSSTGSMTCAGVGSLIICQGSTVTGDAQVLGDDVNCCGDQEDNAAVERGLQWLGKKLSWDWNPSGMETGSLGASRTWLLYYMYGVERVGRLSGRRFIGRHDWYREGAEKLVRSQDPLSGQWRGFDQAESVPTIGTSLALLFLSKGRRPVVISKVKHGEDNDWDHHRGAIQHLTARIERRWKRDLSWQTIDIESATAEDLIQSPVLFLSGSRALDLSEEQKQNLRDYVNQGGFVFAEACCDGAAFDRSFRSLMEELFPDSPLAPLPPDHPIWFADVRVDQIRPLFGINACCRTSIVYCPENLSCYWELSRGGRKTNYPRAIQDEIEACLRIGENVVAYATNRQLRAKLDPTQLTLDAANLGKQALGAIPVAKLMHSGGGDDAPQALTNLLRELRNQTRVHQLSTDTILLNATDPRLIEYPIAFMHGRRTFQLTAEERVALAEFIKHDGFLLADAICASQTFVDSFAREMKAIFPEYRFEPIRSDHPVFSDEYRGFDVRSVTLRDPRIRGEADPLEAKLTKTSPLLFGLEVDGRYAIVFSPFDISCALENQASLECKGYVREDAARLGINILLYALRGR